MNKKVVLRLLVVTEAVDGGGCEWRREEKRSLCVSTGSGGRTTRRRIWGIITILVQTTIKEGWVEKENVGGC